MFPGGVGNVMPTVASYPAVVPYTVYSYSQILLGTPIAY